MGGEVDGSWAGVVYVLVQFSWAVSRVTPHPCMVSLSVVGFAVVDVRQTHPFY